MQSSRKAARRAVRPMLEMLEARQLMSTTVTVPATSDPWLVTGLLASEGAAAGTSPTSYTLPIGTGETLTFSSVTGSVKPYSAATAGGADGSSYGGTTNVTAVGGISGIIDTTSNSDFALLGVFVPTTVPKTSPPAAQSYSVIRSNSTFSPLLNQTFFIGDGLTGTGSGTSQKLVVPAGAVKLYLGFADAFTGNVLFHGVPDIYNDDSGSIKATLTVTIPTYAVTGSVLSDVSGKAGAGLAGWRVYIDQNKDGQYDSGDPSAVTTTTGSFTFNLAPGTYTVSVELKNGYAIAAPKTYTYTVTVSSKAVTGLTFVVKQVAATL